MTQSLWFFKKPTITLNKTIYSLKEVYYTFTDYND